MARSAPDYLRLIDEHTTGNRCDVTPLFADGEAFAALVDDLLALFSDTPFDAIAGIDALGFVLGGAMALRAGCGLVVVRKGGKLPVFADRIEFVDYTGDAKILELRHGAVTRGMRILLVDEWIETGAQVAAAATLIERQQAFVVGIAAIAADVSERTRPLFERFAVRAIR
jgi:adenine phosphoribosyltransferase